MGKRRRTKQPSEVESSSNSSRDESDISADMTERSSSSEEYDEGTGPPAKKRERFSNQTRKNKTAGLLLRKRGVGAERKTQLRRKSSRHQTEADKSSDDDFREPKRSQKPILIRADPGKKHLKPGRPRIHRLVVGETSSESSDSEVSIRRVHTRGRAVQPSEDEKRLQEAMQKQTLSECTDPKDFSCPVPGCDSSGHFTGKFERHHTISGCPLYHNTTAEDCRVKAEERTKKEKERAEAEADAPKMNLRLAYNSGSGQLVQSPARQQQQKKYRVQELRRQRGELVMSELKDRNRQHRQHNQKSREPLLDGLTSQYDLDLFREAQIRAAEELENEGLPQDGKIRGIEFGKYALTTWYSSPYPEEFARLAKLFICEFCLKYMKSSTILRRHLAKCVWRHPPGNEIYRKGNVSIFEVDGKKSKIYCQNLCLLAKLFLDHKTLYFDVEPFLFYIMIESDNTGCHIIGYFSKEKNSFLNYNVSCILIMPQYMRKGYGKMLIDFSYLLTRVEEKIGSPEKPLSDLGLISYRSYWKEILLQYLHKYNRNEICIKDISQETGISPYDIVSTLQALQMLKYWKGKHLVLKREDLIEEYVMKESSRSNDRRTIDPGCLKWSPYTDTGPG